ncbi:tRNA 2-selenouridine synthase [Campylobacter concisus]|uniref:tRNA 2-selenouridine synthase n=2 Tax=Campylobacter concisus TaxID=199 RepID=UPI001F455C89|nr:tRNA 2-selenouridine synthase [Campylobacter concisus]
MNFLTSLCEILRFLINYFKILFMKFTAFILLLLTSIFLIACSANQANKKISNSELENLAKQYGGVYIFNQKFVNEIDRREKERSDYMDDFFKNNKRNFKRADLEIMDQKLPQILSNGKPYFLGGTSSKISQSCYEKIYSFIGHENLKKYEPWIFSNLYYKDKEGNIVQISCTVVYERVKTQYGLFGDEGRGFSFKKNSFESLGGGNKFILTNNKFIKANKDK